ncbi:precorrin-6y C5,15-methyltransferase (decarboxylating) subunit CbiE [Actinoallomurus purpureus]|uniref:precorrin-6y C5,15-methyltransferase (decarboxylating) subunit CbiE n=1 Tax=Actinoallomurus purpureus TaxID=478114 RepID=UPI002093EE3F|nr:precorrin-6y C5,15-methyltransferase (decarboxylating) subunit CbiE [Actinoallomurus purpureus]MCO6010273.1 precorrin-6y C5,15-methyltransferase (decarboxylating) subunit CbiE [Actinoallomurus purpureus]
MITVVGCDGSPLPERAMDRLQKASLVVGGRRHLEAVRPPERVRRIVLGDVPAALAEIDAVAGDDVVVLASGDPGFFGILRSLREHGHAPEVLPAVSSVAGAFARIGLPWDDAVVVSAHGRDPRAAVNACRAMPKVAVLTSPACGPGEIGAELAGWDRVLWVAERLGGPGERVVRCTPAEAAARDWTDPNVVIALDEHRPAEGPRLHDQPTAPPDGWAYADDGYEHRAGMITKWEVRAVVLSRLRPTLGTLIWDVGAGSGSVGVECAEHHAAVIAVERDPAACDLIRRNARSTGVRVVEGAAPEAYDGLPDPDAVFVGGGGLDALGGALARRPGTAVATFAAVDRAVAARRLLADAGYAVEGVQLAASRFADLPGGSFRLDAQNPVFVLTGRMR